MKDISILIAHLVVTIIRLAKPGGARSVVAETLLIKHQLQVSNRTRTRSPNLSSLDRFLLGVFSLLIHPKRMTKVAVIIKPSTLLRFHQALVKQKYRQLFSSKQRRKPGPKGPSQALIDAIVEMKLRNPRYGCPRIAQQINLAFGTDIDKDVVRRVLEKHVYPTIGGDGPSWLTFIGHMKDSLWSADFFRCESILLKSHWIMVVMDQYSRRIVGFAVQAGCVDGPALCRLFNQARQGRGEPTYLSTDNDPLYRYKQWQANLRILDIEEIKSIPFTPTSHPFIERVIGSVRREYLDQTLFWNQIDLQRKLDAFQTYYNQSRAHTSLDGNTPLKFGTKSKSKSADLKQFQWQSHCRGLFQLPMAA